jgi:hypothetical protein
MCTSPRSQARVVRARGLMPSDRATCRETRATSDMVPLDTLHRQHGEVGRAGGEHPPEESQDLTAKLSKRAHQRTEQCRDYPFTQQYLYQTEQYWYQ